MKKLHLQAQLPLRQTEFSAGLDLSSIENCLILPKSKRLIDTGLSIELPYGVYGRIAPRSGLALNNFIQVGAGVIDADYRGSVKVLLFNHSEKDTFYVNIGDKIAQLICEKILYPKVVEVLNLSETIRNQQGFGSTS